MVYKKSLPKKDFSYNLEVVYAGKNGKATELQDL